MSKNKNKIRIFYLIGKINKNNKKSLVLNN